MVLENQATLAYRLSPIQEQVWAHQRASSALSYRVLCVVQLEGQLDASRLRDAIARTVVTHEILRTSYVRQPGMTAPFQVISASPNFAWEVVDAGKDVQFERLKTRAFDLEHGSVLSATLANINPEKHTLLLGLPAMAADTASLILLVKEIAREYSGEPAIAEDDLMQFVDVSEWQHELLQSEEAKPGREWWRDFWRSVDAAQFASLALPLEKHGGAFSPGSVPVALDSVLAARVEALAKRENKPLQHFLLTSWQILLSRITGRSDVVVGVTVDNRRHQELKRTLGPLSMNLPLRLQLDGGESFGQVLTQVSEISSEICMWQDSFSWAEAGEGLNHLPTGYEYMDLGEPIVAGDVGMEVAQLYSCTERFKVKLVVLRSPQGLGLELHYDRSRYSEQAMASLAAQFRTLLASAVADPKKAVGELAILPAEARQRLLVEWNRTERAYPAGETMVSLFEVQAAKTPERTAVVAAGEQLTYSELNRRANQLAQALRAQGVAADAVVGLCLDRSVDLLVAILGILKAGGGYVPLNPDHPASRLEQQLSGVQVLVTQAQFLEKLPTHSRAVICLDRDQEMLAQQSASNPAALAGPENLVYVIYTSGSTGVPKGVEIEHRNLANYARFIAERLELENYPDGLRFATVSTIAADLGNTCIYPALIAGGTVHLISYEQATDAAQLGRYMQEHAIDVIKIVPSHLWALLASEEGGKVLPLKYLITGGEALTPRLLERLAQLGARCEVINHYGPTETTVGSVTLRLREAAGQKWDGSAIPLGRPIANTRVYILDGRLQPVPVGVMGELYIAGAGVGRGYRGQPQMTGERFLHDPFAADARARMYRTGDLARYLEDGNIEFLGRGDDQVKVRGFRIELGEIEAALAAHAAVKQAVVLAREDQETGEKRLLAYAVLQREKPATAEDLRQHLRAQLPDYMVPSAVILLDKLPLNANGKVDRQALPSVEEAGQAQQRAYLAPRTPVEEVVANIWAEVLRLPQVGADDNFFELGGHSLLATQVVSRVREHFRVELALRSLFEKPTVVGLAAEIEASLEQAKQPVQPSIQRAARDRYRITTNQG
jgi:amino acid adenylation domain-containing protein